MTAVVARALRPRPDGRSAASFAAALAMHAALVGSMWFAVQWRTSASAPAIAELWELPALSDAQAAPPVPAPAPLPPPPAEASAPAAADIVQKQEAPQRAKPVQRKDAPRPNKKAPPVPAGPSAEEVIQQQEQQDEQHREEMSRLRSQAGAPTRSPALPSLGPVSNEYGARIQAAVRAHLSFAVPEGVPASLYAEFAVELLPTGEQASEPRLVKPSGLAGFDEAARRAILRTDPFPRRDDGTVPRTLSLKLYPQDAR